MNVIADIFGLMAAKPWDLLALGLFALLWLGYEPILNKMSKKSGLITKDLSVVRHAWMSEMVKREQKLLDANLMGHAIDSATHFSSANLLLIAAVAGALFSGHLPFKAVSQFGIDISSPQIFHFKLALIILCLARGLLNFVWALRQMNYCSAAFGSLPANMDNLRASQFSDALSMIIDPAMSNFSQGVRGYYFALAAAAWLFGPFGLIIGSLGAISLLSWRQSRSQSSLGLRRLRELLDEHPFPTQARPLDPTIYDDNRP